MLIVIEEIDALRWEVFSNDTQLNDDLQVLLGEKNVEVTRTTFLQVLSLV